jgi:hypothetical protein
MVADHGLEGETQVLLREITMNIDSAGREPMTAAKKGALIAKRIREEFTARHTTAFVALGKAREAAKKFPGLDKLITDMDGERKKVTDALLRRFHAEGKLTATEIVNHAKSAGLEQLAGTFALKVTAEMRKARQLDARASHFEEAQAQAA